MPIYKVLVVGGGTMGSELARLMVRQGMPTVVKEMNAELTQRVKERVYAGIERAAAKGKISEIEAEKQKALVDFTDHWDELRSAEGLLVIEAVPENLELKQNIFADLEKSLSNDAIFTSNTSSLMIASLVAKLKDKSRLVGMHFFNPPTKMPLVELIPSEHSSSEILDAVEEFARSTLQKQVIRVKDRPGFLVNVFLGAYLQPALLALEQTIVKPEEIDKAAISYGWPVGPLLLMDALGLDICREVMQVLNTSYPERFGQSRLLEILVTQHHRLGQKSGIGFYEYGVKGESLEDLLALFLWRKSADAGAVFAKMIGAFVEEVRIAYESGIATKEDIIDGCIYGLGFPEKQKGIFDSIGKPAEKWI